MALGDRHPLHPVRPALELQVLPGIVPPDHERHLVDAAEVARVVRQGLDPPVVTSGVGEVHVVEVAGEEVGFFTTLGAADLHDDGSTGVRIARQEQLAKTLLGVGDLVESSVDLDLHRRPVLLARAGVQLLCGFEVTEASAQRGVRLHDRLELAVPLRHDPELDRIRDGRRVGQARLELAELVGDGGEASVEAGVEHDAPRLPGRQRSPRCGHLTILSCNDS